MDKLQLAVAGDKPTTRAFQYHFVLQNYLKYFQNLSALTVFHLNRYHHYLIFPCFRPPKESELEAFHPNHIPLALTTSLGMPLFITFTFLPKCINIPRAELYISKPSPSLLA